MGVGVSIRDHSPSRERERERERERVTVLCVHYSPVIIIDIRMREKAVAALSKSL